MAEILTFIQRFVYKLLLINNFFFFENKKVIDGIDKLQIRLVNGVSDIYGSS